MDFKKKRNKSASLGRRREENERRRSDGNIFFMEGGDGEEEEEDIVRPPSRQSNAFPMSLGGGKGSKGDGVAADVSSTSGCSAEKSGAASSSANHALESAASTTASAAQEKRPRPSSRKKHPAKAMFLNDAQLTQLGGERVVVGSPEVRKTGWGMEHGMESGEVVKNYRESPSTLSLGDDDDEVEFVLGSTGTTVGRVTQAQKRVDERRDNPDTDGFAELEESGLYEIKIELNSNSRLGTPVARGGERGGIVVVGGSELEHSGINIGSPIRSLRDQGGGGGAGERGEIDDDEEVEAVFKVGARTIRTAPGIGRGGGGGVMPVPPEGSRLCERPDTVGGADLILPGEESSDSDGGGFGDAGFGDAGFTPVSKAGVGWGTGGEEDDDLLLSSFHGDELEDLNDDWNVNRELESLNTNLGTDFLSLFAPSPTPK